MARRGFFAELNHQAKVAAREQERAARQAEKERRAAIREAERTRKAEERAAKQLARANEAERKRLEKEAQAAHIAAMNAEVERRNSELASIYDELDSILASTLEIDDHVDLESLKASVEHPPFDRSDLEKPAVKPKAPPLPPEPQLVLPKPPSGLARLFFQRRHAAAVKKETACHETAMAAWQRDLADVQAQREEQEAEYDRLEAQRQANLQRERRRYEDECSARESEAAERNRSVDELIVSLGYGTVEAIEEYVRIVLSNSVYPQHFEVQHEFSFDPSTAELQLKVLVPGPSAISAVKAYKYAKAADEIVETKLSAKACKDRYASVITQVALRSLHEVFEADRRGLIRTISAEIGTEANDPATGRAGFIPFVGVGAERDAFLEFDLSAVVPAATLAHLGAAVSKSPYDLVRADTSGVRRS